MRIDVQRLGEGPFEYEVELSPAFLAGGLEEELRFDPGRGKVTFRLVSDEVFASGRLTSTAYGTCARCLGDAAHPFAVDVHLYYWPREKEPDSDADALEFDPDAPDCAYYAHGGIEPDDDLRELLLVEVPAILTCGKSCKGLCPHCGQNLNEGACVCSDDKTQQATPDTPAPGSGWQEQLKNIELE